MEEKEKEALFDELYRLDEEDSSEEDRSDASVILHESRLALSRSDVPSRVPRNSVVHSSSLLRTVSAPLPQPSASGHRHANVIESSSFSSTASFKASEQVIIDTPVIAKKTTVMTPRKEASKPTGKRKRGQSLELKPESQQIFNGLAFCESRAYEPCNSVASNRI